MWLEAAHEYQLEAKQFLLDNAAAGLLLDPGLGKTSITLSALADLKEQGDLGRTLIIAPLRVCSMVWPEQLAHWDDFRGLTYTILHGDKKNKLLENDTDLYIINPEGLEWLSAANKWKNNNGKSQVEVDVRRWKSLGFDRLVIDELSKFKDIGTIRFKIMKQVLRTFRSRWGLTGSPASNGLLDLFGQAYMLDEGQALGPYVTYYRRKYFDQNPRNQWDWKIKPDAERQIYDAVQPLMLRIGEDDIPEVQLPKRVDNLIKVELPKKFQGMYKLLEKDMIAQFKGRVVVADTAAIASMKCRQVANGGIYYYPGIDKDLGMKPDRSQREVIQLHDAKTDALEELVEELQGASILVGYEFEHDLLRLQKRFRNVPHLGKSVNARESNRVKDLWNAGKIPVLFAQIASIAHGLNLQGGSCRHVCFYSMIWDFEHYDQFVRRVARQGNKERRVMVHHIMAQGTVDEDIYITLKNKGKVQKDFLQAMALGRDR